MSIINDYFFKKKKKKTVYDIKKYVYNFGE